MQVVGLDEGKGKGKEGGQARRAGKSVECRIVVTVSARAVTRHAFSARRHSPHLYQLIVRGNQNAMCLPEPSLEAPPPTSVTECGETLALASALALGVIGYAVTDA